MTFSKRKGNSRKWIISVCLIILIVFFFNLFQKEVRSFFYYISSPIQKVLWSGGDNFSDFLSGWMKRGQIEKEKENLKLENQKLMSEITRLREKEKENKSLKEALDVGLGEEFNLAFVRIISKDISTDTFLIDKGKKDGILKGMPVITAEKVLVGEISEAYDNFSKVRIITHKKSSFGVKIQEKEIIAIAKGKGNLNLFLDLIPKEKEVVVGDSIITAGLEKAFPPDLLVGRVKEIIKEDVESMQRALVEISFDFDRNTYLFVVENF